MCGTRFCSSEHLIDEESLGIKRSRRNGPYGLAQGKQICVNGEKYMAREISTTIELAKILSLQGGVEIIIEILQSNIACCP